MLDTNVASYIIKGQYPEIRQRLVMLPADSVVVSAVTQGELYYGVACRDIKPRSQLVHEFLSRLKYYPGMKRLAECMAILGLPAPRVA